MQWKIKKKPELGSERVVTRFLLLPKVIGDTGKWMEVASWRQRYVHDYIGNYMNEYRWWEDVDWVE